ncbi:DUF5713 family protein [Enhygromyxa salina]|uniref:Uncharacterized protein n=1 Tax=Enhygromyxa salina TaxID=215803 RepID=A0A2S9YA73_9BACT|nr:DUF5713 family protein [Enhygromyxa salina]PRQ02014.1 hypothetical protein ENSA7_56820 [Enhygromyxa salina]
MTLVNAKTRNHQFLREMYADRYFPDPLVDEGKAILVELCRQIETQQLTSEAEVFALTHAATEAFNELDAKFQDQGSEIETAARECIASNFEFILTAYGFEVDLEEAIAPRDW